MDWSCIPIESDPSDDADAASRYDPEVIMKHLRTSVFVAFLIVFAFFVVYEDYLARHTDVSYPEIRFDSGTLSLPVTASDEDLLSGVTAYDEKDGDITSRIIVESISNFSSPGVSTVTYAVVDNDDHAVKAHRTLIYTDYVHPRFTFQSDMIFEAGTKFNLLDLIGATDVIDGDISEKVKLISSELNTSVPGVYQCQAQVTNSKGDVSYLEFNVTITGATDLPLDVELTDYLIYLNVGDTFIPGDYYKDTLRFGTPVDVGFPLIQNGVSTKTAGTYKAYYDQETADGAQGVAELLVIVEDEHDSRN